MSETTRHRALPSAFGFSDNETVWSPGPPGRLFFLVYQGWSLDIWYMKVRLDRRLGAFASFIHFQCSWPSIIVREDAHLRKPRINYQKLTSPTLLKLRGNWEAAKSAKMLKSIVITNSLALTHMVYKALWALCSFCYSSVPWHNGRKENRLVMPASDDSVPWSSAHFAGNDLIFISLTCLSGLSFQVSLFWAQKMPLLKANQLLLSNAACRSVRFFSASTARFKPRLVILGSGWGERSQIFGGVFLDYWVFF